MANSFSEILKNTDHFFCISHYNGDISWVNNLKKENYIIYNKSGVDINHITDNYISINNIGYNLYSYLEFIIKNYDNLPNVTVFCKDNLFSRHINIELFLRLIKQKKFTSFEKVLDKNNFPINLNISDNGFVEINNSWYKFNFPRKYFSEYNQFYSYIFKCNYLPDFIRFSPGANYIVPKENILLRTKNFYKNLIKFIDYSEISCESHFLERSLITIFDSNVESSDDMNRLLTIDDLNSLQKICKSKILKEQKLLKKFKDFIINKSLSLSYQIFKFLK